jgi:hypothetical protein
VLVICCATQVFPKHGVSSLELISETRSYHSSGYAAVRVRAQVRSCCICGGICGNGTGFLEVLRFPLPILIPPTAPHSSSYRPNNDRRTKWTQVSPTIRGEGKLLDRVHQFYLHLRRYNSRTLSNNDEPNEKVHFTCILTPFFSKLWKLTS